MAIPAQVLGRPDQQVRVISTVGQVALSATTLLHRTMNHGALERRSDILMAGDA